MNERHYAPADAKALAPLLASIGRELEERGMQLTELEKRMRELRASPFFDEALHELEAEAATQRQALRHCREELERLGCRLVGTQPLTIRIPTRVGGAKKSVVWQPVHRTRA
jgi:uncharacterized coiled-coil protein SlyX